MTTIATPLGTANGSTMKKRKAEDLLSSALTLGDGSVLDLAQLPATDSEVTLDMLRACRDRIVALQNANKVAKLSPVATTTSKKPGSAGPDRVGMARKRLAASFKTSIKGQRFYRSYWGGDGKTTKEVKFNDTVTEEELRALMLDGPEGSRGVLLQPTPTNNPKSNVRRLARHRRLLLLPSPGRNSRCPGRLHLRCGTCQVAACSPRGTPATRRVQASGSTRGSSRASLAKRRARRSSSLTCRATCSAKSSASRS